MTDEERANVGLSLQAARKDAQATMRESLSRLAYKLRVEYDDFDTIRDVPMDAQLGENLREQLADVFAILKQSGIDCEKGRYTK